MDSNDYKDTKRPQRLKQSLLLLVDDFSILLIAIWVYELVELTRAHLICL